MWVLAAAVHAQHVGLVLDGTRGKQLFPSVFAGFGPVGHNHEQVVGIAHVAAEDGKAQVVAHDELDVEAAVAHYGGERVALLVHAVFAGKGKEMPLVVEGLLAVGLDKEGTVVELAGGVGQEAAAQGQVVVPGQLVQRGDGVVDVALGQVGCGVAVAHNKAGGEELGQHYQVGAFGHVAQVAPQLLDVGRFVGPSNIVLDECYSQVA